MDLRVGLLVALALLVPSSLLAITCPPSEGDAGTEVDDRDNDGEKEFKFSKRVKGDDATNPRCEIYCYTNNGFGLFYVFCDGKVVHRCPFEGALNSWEIKDGLFTGKSTEGGAPPGNDADGDGTVEEVEYEEKDVDGKKKVKVTVNHDGKKAGEKEVDAPDKPSGLPWPSDIVPVPKKDTPLLPWPWMVALVGSMLLLFAWEQRRRRDRQRRTALDRLRPGVIAVGTVALLSAAAITACRSGAVADPELVELSCILSRTAVQPDGSQPRVAQLRATQEGEVRWSSDLFVDYPLLGPRTCRFAQVEGVAVANISLSDFSDRYWTVDIARGGKAVDIAPDAAVVQAATDGDLWTEVIMEVESEPGRPQVPVQEAIDVEDLEEVPEEMEREPTAEGETP